MLCGVSVDDKGVLQFHGGDFGKSTVGRENKPLLRVPVYSKRGDVLEVQAAHCCGASAIPGGGGAMLRTQSWSLWLAVWAVAVVTSAFMNRSPCCHPNLALVASAMLFKSPWAKATGGWGQRQAGHKPGSPVLL